MITPSKGQTRLEWEGKRTQVNKIKLPFQLVETINEPRTATIDTFAPRTDKWYNKLIWGDNKLVMSSLLDEFAGKIDLIYIDPPFATGEDFSMPVKVGDEKMVKEPSAMEIKAYRDTWGRGLVSYLQMLYERLILMRELLAEDGAIYVHMDWHVGHYVKVILDEIFGSENFRNEIHVKRIRKNVQEYEEVRRLNVANDTILFYAKSEEHRITQPKVPTSKGPRWHAFDAAGVRRGMDYELFGHNPPPGSHWRWTKEKAEEAIKQGILRPNPRTGRPEYLVTATEEILTSDWENTQAYSFETGFPTEKSERLLARIIEMSSKEGDLIADFFCGSGTTLVAAEKLNRRWIGCDLSKFAIHLTRKRLLEIPGCRPFQLFNLGRYQKQKLMENGNGGRRYIQFMLELYNASPLQGFAYIHGKKGDRLVHVGPIDSFVTLKEIREAAREAINTNARGIDVLGWDFEMGLHDLLGDLNKEYGMEIRLRQIPHEVLEIKSEQGLGRLDELKFFDLNYLDVGYEIEGKEVTVFIKKFVIANPEYIPEEIRDRIKNFTAYIDYWAVDFDYKQDVFHNMRQEYRTKKKPELRTSITYQYDEPGHYTILVKVVDIFGNDTNKLLTVRV